MAYAVAAMASRRAEVYTTGTPSRRCLAVSVVLHQRGDGVAVSVVLRHRHVVAAMVSWRA
jgi:hypothetical protein